MWSDARPAGDARFFSIVGSVTCARRAIVLAAAAVTAIACSRAPLGSPGLRDGPIDGGGGSVGSGGSAGSGAAGGRGGEGAAPVAACERLEALATYRSFDVAIPSALGYQPRLTSTRADGTRVTLVVREQQDPIPIDGTPVLTQVSFEPWESWPASPLGTPLVLSAGNDFVLPRQAEDGLTVWLFMSTFATGPQMALFQSAAVDVSSPPPIAAYPMQGNTPAFVTTAVTTSPVGPIRGLGRVEPVAQALAWLDLAGPAALHPDPFPLGCFLLDGVRGPQSFLFACSSSGGFQVGRFGPDTPEAQVTHEQLAPSVAQLQMVPRSDGGWVVWQAADGETSGSLMALRVDAQGQPVTDPMQLIPDGIIFEEVTLAPMGDDLAVAYTDAFDPGPPNIVVEVFDGSGTQRAAGSFTPQAWPRIEQGYGLVASPSADSLLLSWSSADIEVDVTGNAHVYVARLDCKP